MELLPVYANFHSLSRITLSSYLSSKSVLHNKQFFQTLKLSRRLNFTGKSTPPRLFRVAAASLEEVEEEKRASQSELVVEVIGIGSRVDAVFDFCFDSPFQLSSSFRFWDIDAKDSLNVKLQERVFGDDLNPRILEASYFMQSCSTAIILVATAGFGIEHVTALDVLKTVRSRNGFAVAVCLRPFSFEGQRRQDEVKDLVGKIQEYANFCIDIDADTLLKKDLVTLDEALRTANTAVLLAMNTVSVFISEMHLKLIDSLNNNVREVEVSEVLKILKRFKESKIGFGAGNNAKSSILKALYDCPFIGPGVENLNGVVICNIASSDFIEDRDIDTSLLTFRQTAKYTGEIIITTAHEPNLDRNMIVTTILTVGEVQSPQRNSLLSRLAQHFPFVSNFLRRQQSDDKEGINEVTDPQLSKELNSSESAAIESSSAASGVAEGMDKGYEEPETLPSSNYHDINSSSNEAKEDEIGLSDAETTTSSNLYEQFTEETPVLQREPLTSWNWGPGYQIAQEWAKERAGDTSMLDNLSIFRLPVGVRSWEESKEGLNVSYATELFEPKTEGVVKEQKIAISSVSSLGALSDTGFLLVRDFYNSASTMLKSRNVDVPKKQGVLSVRAASMLESERDSPKKWSPVTEMQYRGGVYRGRCQGGLPEGKGQLMLEDGSIYDGMWRYGKRSGPGALYFSNGDVFQGSWRDDVMHGKGWYYFHTGDRWFANFWKGKANGEGRFYAESGEVFFGHFQDGWRHGLFLCIDIDGERFIETWDEGVLVGRKQVDSEKDAR
ncbi:protein ACCUMULATION AND REPLICATION OF CHLOROPLASTS 3, chloroplastic isoform X2 [Mercurialis annua]|uniref:protein ACCUMULATION AND REPLICATION OF CHLOROPLASTS 3, chloroplastic isoform X2 n=1 Tax=Mercurialis annua TaxID=3986 RepID=UPI00215F8A13|nr:protein ACCUMULATION AND REPLICATION OF CHLOROPLASTS 3, chloroplastic isoform X2 [Mercurialis annua]